MLAKKLYTKSDTSFLDDYIFQYTGLFYILYNNLDLICDKNFKEFCLEKFNFFDVSMIDSCINEVETKYNQHETELKKKREEIIQVEKILETTDFITKKDKKWKYNLINKLNKLKRNLNNNITFGGKENLRKITKYKQKLKSGFLTKDEEIKEVEELLQKYQNQYKNNRSLGLYLIGRASDKGNRKITFDLKHNKIIFKPNANNHFEIDFTCKGDKELLYKLQEMVENKEIALTVRLTKTEIHLLYDDEKVNNYHFDVNNYKKELKLIQKENEDERKSLYKKYIQDQESRKIKGKIAYRYASVDLNPEEISLVIGDYIDGKINIIFKECISLKKLNEKNGLSSYDKKTIKQNNKIKHEIKEVWKYFFNKIIHYNASYFVMEDLNFKPNKKDKGTEFNRLTKNMWHRTLTTNLINKYINRIGLIKREVNPCYSSFVGNLCYEFYDPISSALEILRRGIVKYIKGSSLYPDVKQINQEKLKQIISKSDLSYLLGENGLIDGISFNQLYKLITSSGLSYRNKSLKDLAVKNLDSVKSKVIVYQ